MTNAKRIALLSLTLSNAENGLELARQLLAGSTVDLAGTAYALHDQASALVATARQALLEARTARAGYVCSHSAALVASNAD